MLRAVAALLAAVLTSSTLAPLTCSGWEAAAADRMACCRRAAHDCPDQTAADACCAQQEQTRQPATTLSTAGLVAPAVLVATVPAPNPAAVETSVSRQYDVRAVPQLHAPPGSFERPLRI
jgi:hypothetical protein